MALIGTNPYTSLPSGSTIQTVYKKFSDVTTLTSAAYTYTSATNGALNITFKVANSTFVVTMVGQGYMTVGQGVNIGINRTIGGVPTRLLAVDGTSGNSWMGAGNGMTTSNSYTIHRVAYDAPNVAASTVITYTMLFGTWGTGTVYLNYSGYSGESTILIQEIAP